MQVLDRLRNLAPLALVALLLLVACGEAFEGGGPEGEGSEEPADGGVGDPGEEPDLGGDDLGAPDLGSEERDPSAPYYALDHVLQVSIELAPADWDALRLQSRDLGDILGGDCMAHPPEDIFPWYRGTVTVDGETYADVAVRKKGFLGSMSSTKPSLKLRFDKYVDEQLLGDAVKRLTLNNVRQDPSRMNTCMAYQRFAAAGIPAPRCSFATVTLNGQDLGLYVNVESIKKPMLRRHFDDDDGNLYEGTLSDFRDGWTGTLEKKTNEREDDWSDIDAVVAALADPSDAGLEALGELVDLDHFLSFWAMEVLVGHWDGYAGNRNNYSIYREPDGPFYFLPWGADSCFRLASRDDWETPLQSVVVSGAIAHRLYTDPSYRPAYVERLLGLLDTVWDEGELLAEIDRMAAIVQEHVRDEEGRVAAAADTERLREFVRTRREILLGELQPEPPEWIWPLDDPLICWSELGTVDLSFATTWDTLDVEDRAAVGALTVDDYTIEGEPLAFTRAGVAAGLEVDPQTGNSNAVISFLAHRPDHVIEVINFYMAPDLLQPGPVPFDTGTVGIRFLLRPPGYRPVQAGRISSGELRLDVADATEGGRVEGRVHGVVYDVGGR